MKKITSFFFVLFTLVFTVSVKAQIINTPEGKVNCDETNGSPWCGGRMSQGMISRTTETLQTQCMEDFIKQAPSINNTLIIEQAQKKSLHLKLPANTLLVTADLPLQVWLSNTPCSSPPVKQTNCLILADSVGKNLYFSTENKTAQTKPALKNRYICQLTEGSDVFIHFQNNQNTSSKTQWVLTN